MRIHSFESKHLQKHTYRTTTFILSSGVDGALSDDRIAIFSNDSASLCRLPKENENRTRKIHFKIVKQNSNRIE